MDFLTDFADLGLLLPLAGLVGLTLATVGRRREALAWCIAVTGTLGAMLLLKLAVRLWHGPGGGDGLSNPSGHTAAGTVVYAGLLALLGERLAPRTAIALLAGLGFSLVFGLTRLALAVHTVADVLAGAVVGLAGALALARMAGPRRREAPAFGLAVVAAAALAAVLALHGTTLHAEDGIAALAAQIRAAASGGWP